MSPASAYAPGRVEFLGNHTDYNQGVVLAAAIDRGLTVAGISRQDEAIIFTSKTSGAGIQTSLQRLQQQADERWANYPLGVVQQFLNEGYELRGFAAEVSGDVPAGAGLSSSAAFEVATAGLLMKLHEIRMEPLAIAKLCQRAENEFVGVQSGLLDQVTSVFGRANHLVYLDCQSEEVRTIPFPAGFALVIAESGVRHSLVAGEYNRRREECTAAAEALGAESLRDVTPDHLELARASLDPVLYQRAAHIVGENDRVWRAVNALAEADVAEVGVLMNASHESSRTNFENSTPELDQMVTIAQSLPGVLGSRLTGGGFGGGTVTLVEAAEAEEVVEALRAKYAEASGHRPAAFVCQIADGAAAAWKL
ncbi:MAG: galactokinase [Chthoniobacterales bacterium]|nr:galactokinase [Chthoniobacterales bacterium]